MTLHQFRASELEWTLTGYTPFEWQMGEFLEIGAKSKPDVETVPASVPGSVQKALLDTGLIQDWNIGLNARNIEWIENRHWLYQASLPQQWFRAGKKYKIRCKGLDHKGFIYLNGKYLCDFDNCHIEHTAEITSALQPGDNILQILFEYTPKWLGQFHRSSAIRDWKPRFYYTWDWISRVVQVGIWYDILIEQIPDNQVDEVYVEADYDIENRHGTLKLGGVESFCCGISVLQDFALRG